MAEKPILCAAPVVRAILDGRQTQDRRPVKNPDGWLLANPSAGRIGCYQKAPPHFYAERDLEHPFTPGDVLYVRETWAFRADGSMVDVSYGADGGRRRFDVPDHWRAPAAGMTGEGWVPSIHMPKWAARIHLRVLSVGVERVNAISEEDAEAEGCSPVYTNPFGGLTAKGAFAELWDSLYGSGSFDRGDWCWVTRFERVTP